MPSRVIEGSAYRQGRGSGWSTQGGRHRAGRRERRLLPVSGAEGPGVAVVTALRWCWLRSAFQSPGWPAMRPRAEATADAEASSRPGSPGVAAAELPVIAGTHLCFSGALHAWRSSGQQSSSSSVAVELGISAADLLLCRRFLRVSPDHLSQPAIRAPRTARGSAYY